MTTPLDVYTQNRKRLLDLAATLDTSRHETPVPTLPLWTVRETYAHLSGSVADMLVGNVEDLGSAHWTAKQVSDRANYSLADICAEWTRNADRFDTELRRNETVAGSAFDLWHHVQDISAALGETVDRSEASVRFIIDFMAPAATSSWPSDTPPVRLVADDLNGGWQLGEGTAATTVHAPGYELARTIAGRRSRAQAEALGWDNPAPHIAHMPPFDFAEKDQIE